MPAPGVILLLSNSSTRIQGIKTFGKVYKNIFPLHNLLLSDFKFYICLVSLKAVYFTALFRYLKNGTG